MKTICKSENVLPSNAHKKSNYAKQLNLFSALMAVIKLLLYKTRSKFPTIHHIEYKFPSTY